MNEFDPDSAAPFCLCERCRKVHMEKMKAQSWASTDPPAPSMRTVYIAMAVLSAITVAVYFAL